MRETIMAAEIAGIAISGSQKDYAACVAFFSAFLTTFFSESHYEPNISTD
ncbi:hypothetical protein HY310_01720 [Candidatus Microgenomates bacterium]|nr:hypothetical protein [Candidatus Microgenomates bacterium]